MRVGIELSPAACRIVVVDGGVPWRRGREETRVRSFATKGVRMRHSSPWATMIIAWLLIGPGVASATFQQQYRHQVFHHLSYLRPSRRASAILIATTSACINSNLPMISLRNWSYCALREVICR